MSQTLCPDSPHLIVISAPSGAGKTTLCEMLLKEFKGVMRLSISATTRAPRGNEQNGVHYFFLSKRDFESKISKNEFAEYATVHDQYYGTLKSTIEDALQLGKTVLLDIDVQGAASLKASYPKIVKTFFISPPSLELLEKRLRSRGTDKEASIQKRLENAKRELQEAKHFDWVIVNDDLDQAFFELKSKVQETIFPNTTDLSRQGHNDKNS